MGYEKKYNEALERAKKVKHDVESIGCSMAPDMLEVIFPELKESEDERIRKALIEVFKEKLERGFEWVEYGIPNRSVLSWLEKQKEQKPNKKTEIEIKEAAEKAALEFAYQYPMENGEYGLAKFSFMRGADWQRQQGIVWSEKDEEKKAYDKGFKAAEEFYCGRII